MAPVLVTLRPNSSSVTGISASADIAASADLYDTTSRSLTIRGVPTSPICLTPTSTWAPSSITAANETRPPTPIATTTPKSLGYGAIVGIVLGVAAGICIAAFVFYLWLARSHWEEEINEVRLAEREARFKRPRRRKGAKRYAGRR
ncbi:Uu.00g102610.m01.CDS01 [Anthostomella pinea]|uniref:Uu.00g102610.m01.CDS01 n=1 Tax=Anthostomella pinea TaxID=933095 RepID=A0AAI8VDG2_9PEZI|nr:Uu.00g102610.m01.CDS01 [Anthostomella pinea]